MESWGSLLNTLEQEELEGIFHAICDRMTHAHIAANPPIPSFDGPRHDSAVSTKSDSKYESILSPSPISLSVQNGDTEITRKKDKPTKEDFDDTFWTSTTQNGILTYWAPRHTTYPQNTTSERARILRMPSVKAAIAQDARRGCSAVDLNAGVGDYAFSYAAAGVQKVLCWDPDAWNIEGLRRGALKNHWHVQVFSGDKIPSKTHRITTSPKARLVAFVDSNDKALARIESMRASIPPVRHVTCGLLPSSRSLYATAAAALDPELGGWIHVHETFGVQEVLCRANKVRADFEDFIKRLDEQRDCLTESPGAARRPSVEHVHRVRSYAAGVFHCVVDIHIPPIRI